MELEVGELAGAGGYGKKSGEWLVQRNGYRDRDWDCQEFRVRAMTMGRKEPSHGTPQTTDHP